MKPKRIIKTVVDHIDSGEILGDVVAIAIGFVITMFGILCVGWLLTYLFLLTLLP